MEMGWFARGDGVYGVVRYVCMVLTLVFKVPDKVRYYYYHCIHGNSHSPNGSPSVMSHTKKCTTSSDKIERKFRMARSVSYFLQK